MPLAMAIHNMFACLGTNIGERLYGRYYDIPITTYNINAKVVDAEVEKSNTNHRETITAFTLIRKDEKH